MEKSISRGGRGCCQGGGYANTLFSTLARCPGSYLFALLGHSCHPKAKNNTRVGFCLFVVQFYFGFFCLLFVFNGGRGEAGRDHLVFFFLTLSIYFPEGVLQNINHTWFLYLKSLWFVILKLVNF